MHGLPNIPWLHKGTSHGKINKPPLGTQTLHFKGSSTGGTIRGTGYSTTTMPVRDNEHNAQEHAESEQKTFLGSGGKQTKNPTESEAAPHECAPQTHRGNITHGGERQHTA